MPTRYDLSRDELAEIIDGPAFRVDQVWHGLYKEFVEPSELTTLSKVKRAELAGIPQLAPGLEQALESSADKGDTVKWLFRMHDGREIETVLMHYESRSTVCVSSQAGCAMNCGFCATGQAGFDRHLSAGEIIEQVVLASKRAVADGRRVTNIVFMGMGEPMSNYDNVWTAVERINTDIGLGARHITISTVGIVPGILRLAREPLQVNLAVSLHAANDELRNSLVPINKRYPLHALMEACRAYIDSHNRRLSFEWALIKGVNDSDRDAHELAKLAVPLGAHVNVIPLNPTPGYLVQGTSRNAVHRFAEQLSERGVNVTIRDTRGSDIDAACGQLAATHREKSNRTKVDISRRTTTA